MGLSPDLTGILSYPDNNLDYTAAGDAGLTGPLDALSTSTLGTQSMNDASFFDSISGLDTATMPFPSTTGTPTSGSSSGGILSDLGSILSGVGGAAAGIGSAIGTVTLANKGLTAQASNTLASAEGISSAMSQFMPLILIGMLVVGGIVLLKKV